MTTRSNGRQEQRPEGCAEASRRPLGYDPETVTKGQERILSLQPGTCPVRRSNNRLRSEFLVEEKTNVGGLQAPLDPITDHRPRSPPYPGGRPRPAELEQQRWKLEDLSVGAAHQ